MQVNTFSLGFILHASNFERLGVMVVVCQKNKSAGDTIAMLRKMELTRRHINSLGPRTCPKTFSTAISAIMPYLYRLTLHKAAAIPP